MERVKAIITGGKDLYGVWIEGAQIYSAGSTIEELKANLQEAIALYVEAGGKLPESMEGEYTIEYAFDASGVLRYYSNFIPFSTLSKLSGINNKQLWSYANGYRRPSLKTVEKIAGALHNFGKELYQVQISL
jgi:predicted RNase H-like HicB family nuclease